MSSKKKSTKESKNQTTTSTTAGSTNSNITTTTTTTTTTSTASPFSSPSSTSSSIVTRSSTRSPSNTLSPNLRMDGLDIESDDDEDYEDYYMDDEDYQSDTDDEEDDDGTVDTESDEDEDEPQETQVVKRKKGRPPGKKPECCSICRVRYTPEWRKGFIEVDGVKKKVDLCNACGLHNSKLRKKEAEFKKQNNIKKLLNDD